MSKRHLLILSAVVLAMALYIFNSFKSAKNVSIDADESEEIQTIENNPTDTGVINQPIDPLPSESAVSAAGVAPQVNVAVPVKSPEQQEALLKKFSIYLSLMDKCLKLNSGGAVAPNPAAVTYESLLNHVQSSLGPPIVQLEDWTQFDIVDKAGVKKRVRVDYDYPDGATPNRRLSTYTLNKYGAFEVDNLTNDQADNPNMAYVESLKEGQTVQQQEQSARMYFAQGEEFLYTSKNGILDSMTISIGENTFNCQSLSDEKSQCNCEQ